MASVVVVLCGGWARHKARERAPRAAPHNSASKLFACKLTGACQHHSPTPARVRRRRNPTARLRQARRRGRAVKVARCAPRRPTPSLLPTTAHLPPTPPRNLELTHRPLTRIRGYPCVCPRTHSQAPTASYWSGSPSPRCSGGSRCRTSSASTGARRVIVITPEIPMEIPLI